MSSEKSIKQLAASMTAYITASIVGPLLIFGGAGYYIGTYMGGGKLYIFIGVGIAFIVTNILQFFKIRNLLRKINAETTTSAQTNLPEHKDDQSS